ncbi:MAG: glyoxalase, partial [Actinomycetota bacterium]|nr:glyoxalase [Actinomycetota bacterium]
MSAGIHHLELWVEDLARAEPGWTWLFDSLGWQEFQCWPGGVSWRHEDGSYVVVEQSSDVRREPHDRLRPGLNHLALTCPG